MFAFSGTGSAGDSHCEMFLLLESTDPNTCCACKYAARGRLRPATHFTAATFRVGQVAARLPFLEQALLGNRTMRCSFSGNAEVLNAVVPVNRLHREGEEQ